MMLKTSNLNKKFKKKNRKTNKSWIKEYNNNTSKNKNVVTTLKETKRVENKTGPSIIESIRREHMQVPRHLTRFVQIKP